MEPKGGPTWSSRSQPCPEHTCKGGGPSAMQDSVPNRQLEKAPGERQGGAVEPTPQVIPGNYTAMNGIRLHHGNRGNVEQHSVVESLSGRGEGAGASDPLGWGCALILCYKHPPPSWQFPPELWGPLDLGVDGRPPIRTSVGVRLLDPTNRDCVAPGWEVPRTGSGGRRVRGARRASESPFPS